MKKLDKSREGVSLLSPKRNRCGMQRNQDTIEISSERDSLLRPVAIEEEVASMQDS